MKFWPLSLIILGGYGLFAPAASAPERDVLVIYGNLEGYLSPCGCTYPMSGGIQRFGTFVKELQTRDNHSLTLVIPGGNVAGAGEQSEFKAECLAETANALGASALGFSVEEAGLGPGIALEMSQLSGGSLVSSDLVRSERVPVISFIHRGRFILGSFSHNASSLAAKLGAGVIPEPGAMGTLLAEAQQPNSMLAICFDGDQQQAEAFARKYPQIGVVVYRSTSDAPANPEKVGNTLLVTPGFHGKNVVTLTFEDGKLERYSATLLGPDFKNDPETSSIYSSYLHRVEDAHLLQKLPRLKTAAYAGSQSCRSCHEKAYESWSQSGHSHAYKDLSAHGHGLDPDCVSCHVVGLYSKSGFSSVALTPQFANVGCESCHGPGLTHELHPHKILMPKVQPGTCVSCHTLENSPGFDYATFWPRVAH